MIRVSAAFAAFALLACTHVLEISNKPPRAPFQSTPATKALTVGVVNAGDAEHEGYVEGIARALQLQAEVARVVYPYVRGTVVDVVANVNVTPEYGGSGRNFWINWPGFFVFAPAWNGYRYRANPRTKVQLSMSDGEQLEVLDWDHEYIFHQADMGRTWTEIGWLEWGVTPLIAGFFFMNYDTDQTPHFITAVSDDYGKQVAGLIAQGLTRNSVNKAAPAPAAPEPVTPNAQDAEAQPR